MTLVDQIRALFKRSKPDAEQTTTSKAAPPSYSDAIARFTAETSRAAIVKKCREMYAGDPRARKMIRMLARDLVKGGYVLTCSDHRAVEIAEGLRARLSLDQRLDDWVRLSLRDGDSFLELGVNQRMEISEVTRKPTLQVRRSSDDYDRFLDPERAFWQADSIYIDPPKDAVWFAEWQIIHARWEHDEGSRYGTPMMAAGTGHWKKVTEGELDIAIRRKTRAGMKFNHKFPDNTGEDVIEKYREINQEALDDPFAAVADYFGTVDINVIQGDAHLAEIADVQHQISTWFTAGEVPMELVAYGENLNRDVLEDKKAAYDETVEQLREWVTAELVRPLLEIQWLLQGIYPPSLNYSIKWQTKRILTPQDILAVGQAAMQLRIVGVREEVIWTILAHFLPGVDVADLAASTDQAGGDTERFDQILSGSER